MSTEKSTKTIKSVEKAFALIDYLANCQEEEGVSEISAAMGSGVSATFHMLNTLKELGIISQNSNTKKYKLGFKLWQLGLKAQGHNELAKTLGPFLRRVREETGETANLTVLGPDNKVVYIAQEASDYLVKMFTSIGASAPLHCTGSGKILLAYQQEAKREEIVSGLDLIKYTNKTITDKSEFLRELDRIRQNGFGTDDEEREYGVKCIGAPIFGPRNEVMACLSISGPKERFRKENIEKWIELVKKAASDASAHLQSTLYFE